MTAYNFTNISDQNFRLSNGMTIDISLMIAVGACFLICCWVIILNGMVIWGVWVNKNESWFSYSKNILSVTIIDLLVGVTIFLCLLSFSKTNVSIYECVVTTGLCIASQTATSLNVLRFCVIRFYSARRTIVRRESSASVVVLQTLIIWLFSSVVITIPLILWSDKTLIVTRCTWGDLFSSNRRIIDLYMLLVLSLPTLATTLVYGLLIGKLKKTTKIIHPENTRVRSLSGTSQCVLSGNNLTVTHHKNNWLNIFDASKDQSNECNTKTLGFIRGKRKNELRSDIFNSSETHTQNIGGSMSFELKPVGDRHNISHFEQSGSSGHNPSSPVFHVVASNARQSVCLHKSKTNCEHSFDNKTANTGNKKTHLTDLSKNSNRKPEPPAKDNGVVSNFKKMTQERKRVSSDENVNRHKRSRLVSEDVRFGSSFTSDSSSKAKRFDVRAVALTIGFILVLVNVSNLPFILLLLIRLICPDVPGMYGFLSLFFILLNSAMNPIIYAIRVKPLRIAFIHMCKACCCFICNKTCYK